MTSENVMRFPEEKRRIGVFSLSSRRDDVKASCGLENLSQVCGGVIKEAKCATQNYRNFAGTDTERADAFNALVADPEIDVLIALRGGYGITRILERIDFEGLRVSGKVLCGFSDVSALLLAAFKHGCRHLIHGPMVASGFHEDVDSEAFQKEIPAFMSLLSGRSKELIPAWAEYKVLKSGSCIGQILATNLTLLNALLGTEFMPDLSGAILVLEDVGEPAHDVDRNLNHLRQCGILQRLNGIILGQFTLCDDREYLPEILGEYVAYVKGPAVYDFTFGHLHPAVPLPYTTAEFKVSDSEISLRRR